MENTETKQRRSVKLSKEQRKRFKQRVRSFDTKTEAAQFFEFSIVTLDAVLLKGSGKPETIGRIIKKIAA